MTISSRFRPFAQPLFAVALFISTCFYIAGIIEFMNGYVASIIGDTAVIRNRSSNKNASGWVNSDKWLNAKRYGNIDDGSEVWTNEILEGLLLGPRGLPAGKGVTTPFSIPLSQSVATPDSLFLTWKEVEEKAEDTPYRDAARLMYLALHYHQHQPARAEAAHRIHMYKHPTLPENARQLSRLQEKQVGRFDYECPTAKFLVSFMSSGAGLGLVARKQVAPIVLAGLQSGRVVTFLNNLKNMSHGFDTPWGLASCDRLDLQCFFMPPTPCVLTEEDLKNGTIIDRGHLMTLLNTRSFGNSSLDDRKVLIMNPPPTVHKDGFDNRDIIHRLVRTMYDTNLAAFSSFISPGRLKAAEEVIRDKNDTMRMQSIAVSYSLRPNLAYNEKLKSDISELFGENFNAQTALGIPIRSSDKCLGESECLSFQQYVNLSIAFSLKKGMKQSGVPQLAHETIVFTTESRPILDLARSAQQNSSFPFKVILNDNDVAQGTGSVKAIAQSHIDADDVMFSTFMSIKMQLMAGDMIRNCCSNIHMLISSFAGNGFGESPLAYTECLQDNENPAYRVCCAWTRNEFCNRKREEKTWNAEFKPGSDIGPY